MISPPSSSSIAHRKILFVLPNGRNTMLVKVILDEPDLNSWSLLLSLIASNLIMNVQISLYDADGILLGRPTDFSTLHSGAIYVAVPLDENFVYIDYYDVSRGLLRMQEFDLKKVEIADKTSSLRERWRRVFYSSPLESIDETKILKFCESPAMSQINLICMRMSYNPTDGTKTSCGKACRSRGTNTATSSTDSKGQCSLLPKAKDKAHCGQCTSGKTTPSLSVTPITIHSFVKDPSHTITKSLTFFEDKAGALSQPMFPEPVMDKCTEKCKEECFDKLKSGKDEPCEDCTIEFLDMKESVDKFSKVRSSTVSFSKSTSQRGSTDKSSKGLVQDASRCLSNKSVDLNQRSTTKSFDKSKNSFQGLEQRFSSLNRCPPDTFTLSTLPKDPSSMADCDECKTECFDQLRSGDVEDICEECTVDFISQNQSDKLKQSSLKLPNRVSLEVPSSTNKTTKGSVQGLSQRLNSLYTSPSNTFKSVSALVEDTPVSQAAMTDCTECKPGCFDTLRSEDNDGVCEECTQDFLAQNQSDIPKQSSSKLPNRASSGVRSSTNKATKASVQGSQRLDSLYTSPSNTFKSVSALVEDTPLSRSSTNKAIKGSVQGSLYRCPSSALKSVSALEEDTPLSQPAMADCTECKPECFDQLRSGNVEDICEECTVDFLAQNKSDKLKQSSLKLPNRVSLEVPSSTNKAIKSSVQGSFDRCASSAFKSVSALVEDTPLSRSSTNKAMKGSVQGSLYRCPSSAFKSVSALVEDTPSSQTAMTDCTECKPECFDQLRSGDVEDICEECTVDFVAQNQSDKLKQSSLKLPNRVSLQVRSSTNKATKSSVQGSLDRCASSAFKSVSALVEDTPLSRSSTNKAIKGSVQGSLYRCRSSAFKSVSALVEDTPLGQPAMADCTECKPECFDQLRSGDVDDICEECTVDFLDQNQSDKHEQSSSKLPNRVSLQVRSSTNKAIKGSVQGSLDRCPSSAFKSVSALVEDTPLSQTAMTDCTECKPGCFDTLRSEDNDGVCEECTQDFLAQNQSDIPKKSSSKLPNRVSLEVPSSTNKTTKGSVQGLSQRLNSLYTSPSNTFKSVSALVEDTPLSRSSTNKAIKGSVQGSLYRCPSSAFKSVSALVEDTPSSQTAMTDCTECKPECFDQLRSGNVEDICEECTVDFLAQNQSDKHEQSSSKLPNRVSLQVRSSTNKATKSSVQGSFDRCASSAFKSVSALVEDTPLSRSSTNKAIKGSVQGSLYRCPSSAFKSVSALEEDTPLSQPAMADCTECKPECFDQLRSGNVEDICEECTVDFLAQNQSDKHGQSSSKLPNRASSGVRSTTNKATKSSVQGSFDRCASSAFKSVSALVEDTPLGQPAMADCTECKPECFDQLRQGNVEDICEECTVDFLDQNQSDKHEQSSSKLPNRVSLQVRSSTNKATKSSVQGSLDRCASSALKSVSALVEDTPLSRSSTNKAIKGSVQGSLYRCPSSAFKSVSALVEDTPLGQPAMADCTECKPECFDQLRSGNVEDICEECTVDFLAQNQSDKLEQSSSKLPNRVSLQVRSSTNKATKSSVQGSLDRCASSALKSVSALVEDTPLSRSSTNKAIKGSVQGSLYRCPSSAFKSVSALVEDTPLGQPAMADCTECKPECFDQLRSGNVEDICEECTVDFLAQNQSDKLEQSSSKLPNRVSLQVRSSTNKATKSSVQGSLDRCPSSAFKSVSALVEDTPLGQPAMADCADCKPECFVKLRSGDVEDMCVECALDFLNFNKSSSKLEGASTGCRSSVAIEKNMENCTECTAECFDALKSGNLELCGYCTAKFLAINKSSECRWKEEGGCQDCRTECFAKLSSGIKDDEPCEKCTLEFLAQSEDTGGSMVEVSSKTLDRCQSTVVKSSSAGMAMEVSSKRSLSSDRCRSSVAKSLPGVNNMEDCTDCKTDCFNILESGYLDDDKDICEQCPLEFNAQNTSKQSPSKLPIQSVDTLHDSDLSRLSSDVKSSRNKSKGSKLGSVCKQSPSKPGSSTRSLNKSSCRRSVAKSFQKNCTDCQTVCFDTLRSGKQDEDICDECTSEYLGKNMENCSECRTECFDTLRSDLANTEEMCEDCPSEYSKQQTASNQCTPEDLDGNNKNAAVQNPSNYVIRGEADKSTSSVMNPGALRRSSPQLHCPNCNGAIYVEDVCLVIPQSSIKVAPSPSRPACPECCQCPKDIYEYEL